MLSTLPNTFRAWRALRTDLAVVAGLVGLDIAARLLPHAPDFTPVAASALFAASVLRVRALSVVVPLAGMILADAWLGFYDLRIMAAVYGTLALPACAAWLSGRWRRPVMIAPVLRVVLAELLPGHEFRRMGLQPDVRGQCRRAPQVLHRRAAVPAEHAVRESVLGHRPVRRLLAGAERARSETR